MEPVTIHLNARDNVVVARRRIEAGVVAHGDVAALEPIPLGHKMAVAAIAKGEAAFKYGQVIGVATADIEAGAHVHTHNLAMTELREGAYAGAAPKRNEAARSFMGYRRANGSVGVRNYVGVLTSVNCSATVARMIAEEAERSGLLRDYPNVDGIVPITHTSGCGMAASGEGYDLLRRTLWGTAANPNFGAVMLVGLGCEVIQTAKFARDFGLSESEGFQTFTIQESGGTRRAVEEGLNRLREMLQLANATSRSEAPASAITLGLQCGGSDAWSGLTSNPTLGDAVDRLVALGGSAFLSETPEIYGAEHLLIARAQTPEIAEKLRSRIRWWEAYAARHGASLDNNPSPGNKAGGLTTILEKSLGAIAKAGGSPLMDVIEYAEPARTSGLVFMDSPGFDPCSATGQVASGANMIVFTTGRGSAFGCKPSPSIKLSSNSDLYRRMEEDIDLDCGTVATGETTIPEKGAELLDLILATASGKRTKSEKLGYGGNEFVPWLIGAVL